MPPRSTRPTSITLATPSASYEIVIGAGLLESLGKRLTSLVVGKLSRVFVVTSPEIWGLWSQQVLKSLNDPPVVLFLPSGERHKQLSSVEALAEQLARAGADRDSLLLALGGGVVGDITGFLAAIYMRGIRYVQLPTTLLAQVDSAVGGKTGVNLVAGKNLIGSFHHPLAVIADTNTLATLPAAELRAGLQESVKSGVIHDPKLFVFMERNADSILAGDPLALTRVVTSSVRVKADVVSKDERESGLRMILNFGHTLGHAIEASTGYGKLLHGQAVGWGGIAATYLSLQRGTVTQKEADRIIALVLRFGPLPSFVATAQRLVALTGTDKKIRSGQRAFVLAKGIGTTEIAFDVNDAELTRATTAMLTLMKSVGT